MRSTLYGKVIDIVIADMQSLSFSSISFYDCNGNFCDCDRHFFKMLWSHVLSPLNLVVGCARNLLQCMHFGGWGASAGAHISQHLSNPVTLTTNETLHHHMYTFCTDCNK